MDRKYQIFISSTYRDLIEERKEVIQTILELYHIPIGMEMFSAEDDEQWNIIKRTIDVSDYYVLIVGFKYGTTTAEGISYTQKEYEYALERNIPILAFILHDDVALPNHHRDDDLNLIKSFRNVVKTNNKMADFWRSKEELAQKVAVSLIKQVAQKPRVGWVRGNLVNQNEDMARELTNLIKENRMLIEEIEDLKKRYISNTPNLKVDINKDLDLNESYFSFEAIKVPDLLSMNDIPENIRPYINQQEIEAYNDSLPTEMVIEEYNYAKKRNYFLLNNKVALELCIKNVGTGKANNVFVEIEFPADLVVFKNIGDELEDIENPIPENPINRAYKKYQEDFRRKNNPLYDTLGNILEINSLNQYTPVGINHLSGLIKSQKKDESYSIEENTLKIRLSNLLHTRSWSLPDYFIVPLREGSFEVSISIFCEEYMTSENISLTIKTNEV